MQHAASDVWHRKGVGSLGGGFIALFRHAGELYRPGPASIVKIKWTWAAAEGVCWAYARFYALYRNAELQMTVKEHMYALLAGLGWLLNYEVLIAIRGAQHIVPAATLLLMSNDPELLVDSNWLISDGFEKIGASVPAVHRAPRPYGRRDGSPGIIGRVKITFTEHAIPRPNEIVEYEAWPSGAALSEWLPDDAKPLVAKYRNVPAPAAADKPPPKLDVPLAGGAAIEALGEVALQASSEERIVAYRYSAFPDAKYLRITDVTSDPMKAVRCFDESQLKRVARNDATLQELDTPLRNRKQLVNSSTLYPAINGQYKVTVRADQLLEKVYILPTSVAFNAARMQSTSSFFVADHAVGANGCLLPMRAISDAMAERITRQTFVPNHAALVPVVHAAIQDTIIAQLKKEKKSADPFVCNMNHFPDQWRYAVLHDMQHVPGHHETLEKVFSDAAELSSFVGSCLLHADGGWKKPNLFIKLQINSSEENDRKRKRDAQPMGSVRVHLPTARLTLKCSIVEFNNSILMRGNVPGKPNGLPDDGGTRWVWNLATHDFQSSLARRPTTREILAANPQMAEKALWPS